MYFFCGSDQTWRLELYNKDVDASQIMMNFRAQELIFSHRSDIFVRDFFSTPDALEGCSIGSNPRSCFF